MSKTSAAKTFKRLHALHRALLSINVGVEASQSEVSRLFDLLQAKRIEAFAKYANGLVIKPKAPVHLLWKPFIFDLKIGDMQAECGVDIYDKKFKNIFFRTHDVIQMLEQGGTARIMPTIYSEAYYFENKPQARKYLAWAKRHRPEAYYKVLRNHLSNRTELTLHIRGLMDRHVGATIKGFKMFRAKTYTVEGSIRVLSARLLQGLARYKSVTKAAKYTVTKLKGWKQKKSRPIFKELTPELLQTLRSIRTTEMPTLDAVAVADLPQLDAVAVSDLPTIIATSV